jgi:hypothetical protein
VEPVPKTETGLTHAGPVQRAERLITAAYSLAPGPAIALLLNVFTPSLRELQKSPGTLRRPLL